MGDEFIYKSQDGSGIEAVDGVHRELKDSPAFKSLVSALEPLAKLPGAGALLDAALPDGFRVLTSDEHRELLVAAKRFDELFGHVQVASEELAEVGEDMASLRAALLRLRQLAEAHRSSMRPVSLDQDVILGKLAKLQEAFGDDLHQLACEMLRGWLQPGADAIEALNGIAELGPGFSIGVSDPTGYADFHRWWVMADRRIVTDVPPHSGEAEGQAATPLAAVRKAQALMNGGGQDAS